MKFKYAIQCERMHEIAEFWVEDAMELLRLTEQYIARFGPLNLLYLVGRR